MASHRSFPPVTPFRKSEILKYGDGPAVYLTDQVIRDQKTHGGFSDALKPFGNVVRLPAIAPMEAEKKFIDFLHDREWRVPIGIELSVLRPIGLVYPEGNTTGKFPGSLWEELVEYAYKHGEIQVD